MPPTGSDVGSLFPFIESQAVKRDFRLSYLRDEFQSLGPWKRRARARLLDLLHYPPSKCNPRAELVERIDRGDYIEESIRFNTTPDIRVPAFVLLPKRARFPAPAVVALHDRGGFYFWGREKLVETPAENPVLTTFKQQYYSGKSIASELARQGYVVIVIDMFYWGEFRQTDGLLQREREFGQTEGASLRHSARVQYRNAGGSLGLAWEILEGVRG